MEGYAEPAGKELSMKNLPITSLCLFILLLLLLTSGCSIVSEPVYRDGGLSAVVSPAGFRQRGTASFYGPGFHGRLTANGEVYDMNGLTCAHLTLPFETILLVKNLENDREVRVRVTDRGPYVGGRIIDLSVGAAEELDMIESGITEVLITAVEYE